MGKSATKRKPKAPASAPKPKTPRGATINTERTVAGAAGKRKARAPEEEESPSPVLDDEEEEDENEEEEPVRREFAMAWGSKFMLFRILMRLVSVVGAAPRWVWHRCGGTAPAHVADSHVYRYEREAGFLRHDAAEEAADERIAAARERLRQDNAGMIKSHDQRVTRFAYFERYCLVKHPEHEWCQWLKSLQVGGEKPPDVAALEHRRLQRIAFMPPTEGLVRRSGPAICQQLARVSRTRVPHTRPPRPQPPCLFVLLCVSQVTSYAQSLRDDPDADSYIAKHKGGTIRVYVGAVGACCKEFHAEPPTHEIAAAIAEWEDEDGNESSEGFDFVTDLPTFYAQCWSMAGWGYTRMLQCWVMLLISICLMGRASDVTTFCPLIEDTLLPPPQLWGTDGYPLWIELGMRDWKWRSKKNKKKRYGIRLHRNTLDSRFCPVFWLLLWLAHTGWKTGPIFQVSCLCMHAPLVPLPSHTDLSLAVCVLCMAVCAITEDEEERQRRVRGHRRALDGGGLVGDDYAAVHRG